LFAASVPKAKREVWGAFPEVVIATTNERSVKSHPEYAAAKSGDATAAFRLVQDFITAEYLGAVTGLFAGCAHVRLTAVHAEESMGRNQIAQALAAELAERLALPADDDQVQINVVNHTGSTGFGRLARQALFGGEVEADTQYVLVDDFVGQGGTLANFRGYLINGGASVIGATVLTGKSFSAKISLSAETRNLLLEKHGVKLETWWIEEFGFDLACLTESEARYLLRSSDVDTIRNQILAARQT
jgi:adenine/guanine phosphoribosyltransferase-like PRPP-binding protein